MFKEIYWSSFLLVARHFAKNAKRANKRNPREDRNQTSNKRWENNPERVESNGGEYQKKLKPKKAIKLIPRNLNQERLLEMLSDEMIDVVFATGNAGTGKSFLAVMHGLEGLISGKYERIVICRSTVGLDGHSLGYLPGTLTSKLGPWVINCIDILKTYLDASIVDKLIENGTIELAGTEYMRGRNLTNCCYIVEECQQFSIDAMLLLLTRVGEGCKMILTGDTYQVDAKYKDEKNGLIDIIKKIKSHSPQRIGLVEFSVKDVIRSAVVQEILSLYGQY